MKETQKRGLKACTPCGHICIAAFTLALLSFLPSCTNGTEDDSPAQDTPAYQQPAQKPESAPEPTGSLFPVAAETPEPAGSMSTAVAEAPEPVAGMSTAEAEAPEGTGSPAQEESLDSSQILSVLQADTGDIVLAGGEILRPGYLSACTVRELEPVGIICADKKGKKMLISMDSFYKEKEEYSWGRLYNKKSTLDKVAMSMQRTGPATLELSGFAEKSNTKGDSRGNGSVIRKQISYEGAFVTYLSLCEKKYACAIGSLSWEIPAVLEVKTIYENRSVLQESKAAVARYLRNMGDERASQLEGPALISRDRHILTSNSGYGNWYDKDEPGIWAFKEADDGISEVNTSRFVCIIDTNSKPTYTYEYVVKDKACGDSYPIEVVLARGSAYGFSAMAVAYLN